MSSLESDISNVALGPCLLVICVACHQEAAYSSGAAASWRRSIAVALSNAVCGDYLWDPPPTKCMYSAVILSAL